MSVSNPVLSACYSIFSETRPPLDRHASPEYAEWLADVRAFARLAATEDLGLETGHWRAFSNGAPMTAPAWWRQPNTNQKEAHR